MPIFNGADEQKRKDNLKKLEDLRVAFAERMEKEGYKPEKMVFCSSEDGRFVALAKQGDQKSIVVGPIFGQDGDFIMEKVDEYKVSREEVRIKGTGFNGIFGLGTKGAHGCKYLFTLSDGSEYSMDVVFGRTSYAVYDYKHNALLKTKRRRGNANVVWDFMPIDGKAITMLIDAIDTDYLV